MTISHPSTTKGLHGGPSSFIVWFFRRHFRPSRASTSDIIWLCRVVSMGSSMHGRRLRGFLPHGTSDVSMTSVSWSEPLSFEQLQRKTAFLLIMATVHCLSELASLQCLPAFLIVDTSKGHFFPSHLSKMDRHSFGLADYRLSSSYDDQFRHVFGRRSRSVSPASCESSCRS